MKTATLLALAFVAGCSPSPMIDASEQTTSSLDGGLAWVGDTHFRYDGVWIPLRYVTSGRPLDVYTQTWPRGGARKVDLFWKRADGTVASAPMAIDLDGAGPGAQNTQWRAIVPGEDLVDGATTETWIRAEGHDGHVLWDSDQGRNFRLAPKDEVLLSGGLDGWRMAGLGHFDLEGDVFVAVPGDGLGLLWSSYPTPASYELRLEFRLAAEDDNSGVFLRFRDPEAFGYDNTAWAAVHDGLELQIDETARPDGAAVHRTGAFYEVPGQLLSQVWARPAGSWSTYVVRVSGDTFTVDLDGTRVASLVWEGDPARPERAHASGARFVGLQAHTGRVAFRNVRIRRLP